MLSSLFNTQEQAKSSPISGVTFNRPQGFVDQYGGNGELTGVSNWGSYFTGLDKLGEGYAVEDVQSIGGANPTGFVINRADPNGAKNVYQQRTLTINPDGTIGWAEGSDWKSHTQQSQMEHFLKAGLPMALAMAGGMTAFGNVAGAGAAGGGGSGLSGMDLAADAVLGSGNNIATASSALGSGAGAGIPQFSQLPGYGDHVATLADASGASPFTGGGSNVVDPISGYLNTGATEGSTLGNLFTGAGGAEGAVGAGTTSSILGQGSSIAKDLISKVFGQGVKGPSGLSDLLSLFTGGTNYNKYDNLMEEIKGIYKPDGVYAKALENKLARRDAAAGRNSQYGPRLAELMASLGDSQARALSGLSPMIGAQQGGMNTAVGAGGRLLERGLDTIFDWFGD